MSNRKISSALKNNVNEDLDVIKTIEKIILKKRKYIFKMPPKNTPVILLLSGGIDSIAAWYLLMKKYQLQVYPLVIDTNKKVKQWHQKRSIKYYSKKFKQTFPQRFHQVYYANNPLVAQNKIRSQYLGRKTFLENKEEFIFKSLLNNNFGTEFFGQTNSFIFLAYQYAQYLQAKKGLTINTLLTANLCTDGEVVKHQTLSSLRISNLLICFLSNNWKIQLASIFAEPTANLWKTKEEISEELILKENFNLDKTWSCDQNGFFHCGNCISCWQRKNTFKKITTKDNTVYFDKLITKFQEIKKRIKNVSQKIYSK